MENIIIIAVLLCIIGGIVFYLGRARKRGETCIGCPYSRQCGSKGGACKSGGCDGGGYRTRKKKLPRTIYQKSFKVDGMHCENCKKRVEKAVNDIKGVAGKVHLHKGELTVSYAEKVDDELILSRIKKAGYTVKEINS